MQIGNRIALDAARESLRDQFDAIWLSSGAFGDKEARAIRCAVALDKPRHSDPCSWRIAPGFRHTHMGPIIA